MSKTAVGVPDLARLTGEFSPAQIRSVVESTARINLWTGAIRSGKTVASLVRWLDHIATAPRSGRLVMVAQTKDTAARNLFGVLQDPEVFGPLARHVHYTPGSNTARIIGRTVDVIGAHDVKSERRLRGLTCVGAYVDEATLVPAAFWTQLLGRLSKRGSKVFATSNPDNPAHWLRRDFIMRSKDRGGPVDLKHFHFTLLDNPSLSDEVKAGYAAEFVGLWYKRFILGRWVAAEGAIYSMWDPRKHVVAEVPLILRWLAVGVDYGTTNPFAGILLGIGVDGVMYAVSEHWYDSRHHRRSKTDGEYSEDLRGWLDQVPIPGTDLTGVRPEWTCVDPSAASFIQQLHRDGTTVTPARNDVMDGIRTVATLIGRGKLKVHKSCTNLIAEIPGYSWDDRKSQKGQDVPIKADDHACDALRYAVFTTEAAWRPQLLAA